MWLNKLPWVYILASNGSNLIAFSPSAQNLSFSLWLILFLIRKYLFSSNFFSIWPIGRSGKLILSFIRKFFLSLIIFGSTAAWKVFTFLEIITPFLSTMSPLSKENCVVCFSILKIFFLFNEMWVILIEKIRIKEKKKKNNK